MKPLVIIATFLAVLIGLALAFPDRLLNPGHLMQGHAHIEKNCLSCHKPFRGALSVQCVSCHKPGEISRASVAGTPIAGKKRSELSHRAFSETSCLECHTDHKESDTAKALRAFRHDLLSPALRASCSTCHNGDKPVDAIHKFTGRSCGDCHDVSRWKPARFDHAPLDPRHAVQCLSCHKADLPGDRPHAGVGGNCKTCHTTTAWKPANFNHDCYFRLDRNHRASCATCHTDSANYRSYTCYGCHEHFSASIAAEHLEEGIRNYRNCAKCHRRGTYGD